MNCPSPKFVWPRNKIIAVPCGKCLPCLSNRRNDWSFRLEQELKRSSGAAFITLTYHPKFYPDDGVRKDHFQLFMKRLRKAYGKKLRYYAVGEYGTKHGRAHYHAILFNYSHGDSFVRSAWSTRAGEPYGIVDVKSVNVKRIRYITKYVVQNGSRPDKRLNPGFALMSRSFGLGLWYLTDSMVAWHRSGDKNFVVRDGVKERLPRYFKKFIWPHKEDAERVSKTSIEQAEKIINENRLFLQSEGYDPDKIMAEMRTAVYSRIKQKVAHTQKL